MIVSLPWSRYIGEGDVVVSDISQAGKNLCEGGNDQVLAVSETWWLMTWTQIQIAQQTGLGFREPADR